MNEREELRGASVDRELRLLFQEIARPRPSLHFDRVLRTRLREERQRLRQRRWRLLVTQAYWVTACVASGFALQLVRWPTELPSVPVVCAVGTVFGVALLAPVALFLSLRTGPLSLILDTMEAFRR